MEASDAWSTLLPDLLLDIFRRLEATAVMSCAVVCKPWRRVIMGNASTLRPRPDIFVPSLLLGFVPGYIGAYNGGKWLHCTLSSSQPVHPELKNAHGYSSFVPTSVLSSWLRPVLSSRDGFLLIKRGGEFDDLCLWNPVTGACTFLPMASLGGDESYILVTGYDDLQTMSTSSELEVRILAFVQANEGGGRKSFHYQVFSSKSSGGGSWGPVELSHEFEGSIRVNIHLRTTNEVVCRDGTVHWLASLRPCTISLDVRTGRTWTTELRLNGKACRDNNVVLATSSDGRRLSMIRLPAHTQQIQVWVLTGADQWILLRVVDVTKLVAGSHGVYVFLNVFCPRSGCLRVTVNGQEFLIDVDRGSSRRIQLESSASCLNCRPYQMDWSSYWIMCVSKMKYF
jgi:F-box interacting protein